MTHSTDTTPCRFVSRSALAITVATLLLMGFATVSAHDQSKASVAPGGRFTPNQEGQVFPPEPRNMQNVRWFPFDEQRSAQTEQRRIQSVNRALADGAVRQQLGERYALIGASTQRPGRNKDFDAPAQRVVVFFSHSLNQTVKVILEQNQVSDIRTTAGNIDQPPLGEAESAESIQLASEYLNSVGLDVSGLKGYAIQAFKSDGSGFDTRVAFVSFHVESPLPPIHTAWVDLTTREILTQETDQ